MNVIFFNPSGQVLFTRNDMESGHWVVQEMTVSADFPYDPKRVIERGQRIGFIDPATDILQVFEIRNVTVVEPEHYQQISAEHIAISELQDEHIDSKEITDKTAAQALATALEGTLWAVGSSTVSTIQSGDIGRGSVWNAVSMIAKNWNAYITPRITYSASGAITGRYLDIAPAAGVWRGVRLSISKNMHDATVTYNDEDVLTALYGYGGTVDVPSGSADVEDTSEELSFANVTWAKTADHPAKPSGQKYLEWPEKTALYGRNGRPRFGYYQNGDIDDPQLLLQKTWESLKITAEPRINISGTCADLQRLGYKDEPLRLHDLAIVEVEETRETFYKQIIMLDVDLVDPTANRPEIGDYIPNIVYISRSTNSLAGNGGGDSGSSTTSASSGSGGGGGGRGQSNSQYHNSKYYTEYNRTEQKIQMIVGKYNGGYRIKAGEITLAINNAGESIATINANHINISATDHVHTLAGDLEHDASGRLVIKNAGGMYVQKTESGVTSYYGVWDEGNLTAGVMVQKLNDGSTSLKISADVIDIDGIVSSLGAKTVVVGKLTTAVAEITGLKSGIVECPVYLVSGSQLTLQSASIPLASGQRYRFSYIGTAGSIS